MMIPYALNFIPLFIYFVTECLYHLTSLIYFTYPPPPAGNHLFLLCIYDSITFFLFCFSNLFWFLEPIYKWNCTVFFFCDLNFSLNILFLRINLMKWWWNKICILRQNKKKPKAQCASAIHINQSSSTLGETAQP